MRHLYLFFSSNYFQQGRISSCRCKITLDDNFQYSNRDLICYIIKKYNGFNYYASISTFLYEDNNEILIDGGQFINSIHDFTQKINFGDNYLHQLNIDDSDEPNDILYQEIDNVFTSSDSNVNTIQNFIDTEENQLLLSSLNDNHIIVYNEEIWCDDSYEHIVAFEANKLNFSQYYDKLKEILSDVKMSINNNNLFVINTNTQMWNKLIID